MTLLSRLFLSVPVAEWQCCKKPNCTEKKLSRRYHSICKFKNKITFCWKAQTSWLLLRLSFCWEQLPLSQGPFTAPAGSDSASANEVLTKWDGCRLLLSVSPLVLARLLSYLQPSSIRCIFDNCTECYSYWKILSNWGKNTTNLTHCWPLCYHVETSHFCHIPGRSSKRVCTVPWLSSAHGRC